MLLTNKFQNSRQDKDKLGVFVIIAAGGNGSRFGCGLPKQFQTINGISPIRESVELFLSASFIDGIVCVIPDGFQEVYYKIFKDISNKRLLAPVLGGDARGESVKNGLKAIEKYSPKHVLIHDAVRCFCSEEIIKRVLDALKRGSKAVVPAITPVDSVRFNGCCAQRNDVKLIQTPQGFCFKTINMLYEKYRNSMESDDASLCDLEGVEVEIVEGDASNRKITYRTDVETHIFKTGFGYDAHRFSDDKNRKLFLNGKLVENYRGLEGISDADVGIHSIVDAILGALGEGSIGEHFNPKDKKWVGADSKIFLDRCKKLLADKKARIVSIDVTIVCEEPNISRRAADMKKIIADRLEIHETTINIKGKTTEGMGFEGRKEGISAYSVVTITLPVLFFG
ncbi:MAG: 2-C-methyl-D-erythritol 2,4-cyclodiphosphate synthase [Holosporales bacterium]|jgi:2-C-methyl-D-erythritol 4-phosphate cytidylyltransferase/2-C-methyl-D-erythritol 2,4-cyclodiphosphate synthase|nr:2-C-methyl-D-erythritol 2,4-cyclodiphosphate synthase [Holosporales bacterium]